MKNIADYKYNCIDKSILLPYFKKYYVSIFFKVVPFWLTANFITLISTFFIFALLVIVLLSENITTASNTLVIIFCLHTYIVGDHLDGMQAKHTKTSSPLGEFLDHYLDVFNGAIILYVFVIYLESIPPLVFYFFVYLNSIAFAVTLYEELERNELFFGVLGTLEGVILLIIFFITWLIPTTKAFWVSELFSGYQNYWIVVFLFGIGYLFTIVDVLKRVGYVSKPLFLFMLIGFIFCLILFKLKTNYLFGWILLTLYSGEFIIKIMESYLVGTKKKYPDHFSTIFVVFILFAILTDFLSKEAINSILFYLIFYLAIKLIYLFTSVILKMKIHWMWYNKKTDNF